jgi:hypothetical protein
MAYCRPYTSAAANSVPPEVAVSQTKSPTLPTQTLAGNAIIILIKVRRVTWTGKKVRHHLLARGEVITVE